MRIGGARCITGRHRGEPPVLRLRAVGCRRTRARKMRDAACVTGRCGREFAVGVHDTLHQRRPRARVLGAGGPWGRARWPGWRTWRQLPTATDVGWRADERAVTTQLLELRVAGIDIRHRRWVRVDTLAIAVLVAPLADVHAEDQIRLVSRPPWRRRGC